MYNEDNKKLYDAILLIEQVHYAALVDSKIMKTDYVIYCSGKEYMVIMY